MSTKSNASAERAADAILTLINSRPQSPTRAELAAIIAQPTPANTTTDPNRFSALRRAWSAPPRVDRVRLRI